MCFLSDVIKEMILTFQSECVHTIVPILTQAHVAFQENNLPSEYIFKAAVVTFRKLFIILKKVRYIFIDKL